MTFVGPANQRINVLNNDSQHPVGVGYLFREVVVLFVAGNDLEDMALSSSAKNR
jgi:hypothetical protein